MADDHFELRMARESSAIRQEIAAVRAEMATRMDLDGVRQEIAATRTGMATRTELEALRQDTNAGFLRLERQIAESRVDIIKWSFLFWTGQCFVIIGFLLVFLKHQ